jgi:hypothetical protein
MSTHIMLKCDCFRILVTKARNVFYLGVTRKYQRYASYMFRPFCVIIEDHKLIATEVTKYNVVCSVKCQDRICNFTCVKPHGYGPNIGNWMINYENKLTKRSNYVWVVVVFIYMISCMLYMLTSVYFALLNARLILRYMQRGIFLPLCNCHPLIVAQKGMKPAEEDGRRFRVAAQ